MNKQFDLFCASDCEKLNLLLNRYGVHVEHDLLSSPYIIIDYKTYKSASSDACGRPQRIPEEVRKKAIEMKNKGISVRQIACALGISIGSVSTITKSSV